MRNGWGGDVILIVLKLLTWNELEDKSAVLCIYDLLFREA